MLFLLLLILLLRARRASRRARAGVDHSPMTSTQLCRLPQRRAHRRRRRRRRRRRVHVVCENVCVFLCAVRHSSSSPSSSSSSTRQTCVSNYDVTIGVPRWTKTPSTGFERTMTSSPSRRAPRSRARQSSSQPRCARGARWTRARAQWRRSSHAMDAPAHTARTSNAPFDAAHGVARARCAPHRGANA